MHVIHVSKQGKSDGSLESAGLNAKRSPRSHSALRDRETSKTRKCGWLQSQAKDDHHLHDGRLYEANHIYCIIECSFSLL